MKTAEVSGGVKTNVYLSPADLQRRLGEFGWFLTILQKLKEWQREGYKITDLYFVEGMDLTVGILKNFFPVPVKEFFAANGEASPPSRLSKSLMTELVKRLLALRLEHVGIWKTEKEIMTKVSQEVEEKNFKSFSLPVEGYGVMRFTFSRGARGHTLTVRLLDFVIPTLEQANFPNNYLTFLKSLIVPVRVRLPHLKEPITTGGIRRGGLVIHCGATGSGKTTSIAAQLDYISRNTAGMIITYEEPVEYTFLRPNVLQYEVGIHIAQQEIYDHFLRSTAQVALVGEMRTREQVLQCFDLASRGHLVFTTFHANSVAEGLYALKELMRENLTLMSSTLLAISHQRLELVQTENGQRIVPQYESLILPTWIKDVKPLVDQVKTKIEDQNAGYQAMAHFLLQTPNIRGLIYLV